jgi:hypothetical protein
MYHRIRADGKLVSDALGAEEVYNLQSRQIAFRWEAARGHEPSPAGIVRGVSGPAYAPMAPSLFCNVEI